MQPLRLYLGHRFVVIAVMVALCLGGGIFGMSLGKHVSQSGFNDDGNESARASVLADQVYGRDRTSYVVAIFTAPARTTVDERPEADAATEIFLRELPYAHAQTDDSGPRRAG